MNIVYRPLKLNELLAVGTGGGQTELVILPMLVHQLVANYCSILEICLQQLGNAARRPGSRLKMG